MARARLESSLVNQARRLAGQTVRETHAPEDGEAAPESRTLSGPGGVFVPMPSPPARPAADGYVRRSPVQPLYRRADYYRHLALRILGVGLLLAAACVGVYLLLRLRLFSL